MFPDRRHKSISLLRQPKYRFTRETDVNAWFLSDVVWFSICQFENIETQIYRIMLSDNSMRS